MTDIIDKLACEAWTAIDEQCVTADGVGLRWLPEFGARRIAAAIRKRDTQWAKAVGLTNVAQTPDEAAAYIDAQDERDGTKLYAERNETTAALAAKDAEIAKAAALADGIEDRVQQAYRAATAAQGIEGDRNEIDLGDAPTYIEELEAELARLRAIVAKLPTTKDGGYVIPTISVVYHPDERDSQGRLIPLRVSSSDVAGSWMAGRCDAVEGCYSTPEAAEAAKEKT